MSKYTVIVDGKATEFTGSNAYYNSIRDVNRADRSPDGIAKHHTKWVNEQGTILTETRPGQRTGMPK